MTLIKNRDTSPIWVLYSKTYPFKKKTTRPPRVFFGCFPTTRSASCWCVVLTWEAPHLHLKGRRWWINPQGPLDDLLRSWKSKQITTRKKQVMYRGIYIYIYIERTWTKKNRFPFSARCFSLKKRKAYCHPGSGTGSFREKKKRNTTKHGREKLSGRPFSEVGT